MEHNYQTSFKQSSITPRPVIFKIVWTIITVLYCIALFKAHTKEILINSVIIFILCVSWVRIFFVKKNPKKAFVVIIMLLISVICVMKKFYDVSPIYGKMTIPFVAWLCLATYFNFFIVANN